jgi:hypothetical protein
MLLKQIELVSEHDTRLLMEMVFTSTIDWSTKMSRVIKGRQAREITTHSYWVSYVPVEINVWKSFAKRFKAALRGKEYSESEIGEYCQFADSFSDFNSGKTCMLLTQSSHRVPKIPDNSVDVIITDPPYGGNVQYSELTDLWAVWIKKTLGIQGIIENAEEAIQTRHSGFPSAKTLEQYRNMLSEIFRECHRKLKRRGWLVMTFHNRDMAVWNSLIIAAYDAGFMLAEKNGVVYQPAIGAYTTTLHQKVAGSMLGDFIMSFRRADNPPEQKKSDIKDIEDKVFKHIDNVIRYQGGASINMIYMQLIPILTNEGLLHKVAQTDLEPFLRKRYVKTGEKWYFREDIDETGRLKPIELVPSEKRIENLIRSILAEKNEATLDEIYQALYVNLINGMTPEKEQVDQILDRLAEKVATTERARWRLKTQRSLFGEIVPSTKRIKRRPSPVQVQLHDTGKPAHIQEEEFSEHDLMIKRLAEIAFEKGFDVHIGITEQRKNESFRRISRPMGDNVEFGIENEAFKIIQEIDILWFKGRTISSAFEVEFSTTIDSGINRFRNLFAVLPNLNVEAYIVVPDDRVDEARKKINSPANVREGISHRVKAVEFTKVPEIS